jgi:hypothetical protein
MKVSKKTEKLLPKSIPISQKCAKGGERKKHEFAYLLSPHIYIYIYIYIYCIPPFGE